eukprot:1456941-Pyramimonas_sp.AAC.1
MAGRAPCRPASKEDLAEVLKKHITSPSSAPPHAETRTWGSRGQEDRRSDEHVAEAGHNFRRT